MALTEKQRKIRTYMVTLAFVLFSVFVIGIFYFVSTPWETVTVALSYAAGLSMIVLPCTLPLVFVIVPLSMGEKPVKGLTMAVLFGLGLVITIGLYGVIIAKTGAVIGLAKATIILFTIGGIASYVFGLSELKLVKLQLPVYGGAVPSFIEGRGDYLKSFFLGLFLGNAGIGCPNPAFYILLMYIASIGKVLTGFSLAAIHGIGRATPLVFLSILGILGVNATGGLVKRRQSVERMLGWSLVFIGAVIIVTGGPWHAWYEHSIIHKGWNQFMVTISGGKIGEALLTHEHPELAWIPQWLGPYVLVALMGIPIIWNRFKKPEV